MAAGSIPLLQLGVVATAALTQFRGATVAGAVPAAAATALGIAQTGGAIGERVPVAVLGTTLAEAGAAIAAGAALEYDASGRVITRSAGVTIGRMAPGQTAGAAGDLVEIVLIPN
ncbi:MAG: DUF2190 family protein [Burkholderiaceae bacterium]|nr:DUF2190 family protein [Burkholderiaceae bacterium]